MRSIEYPFDLLSHLVWRDFVLRYKRSLLGVLWSLLLPLAQLAVLVLVFEKVVPLNIKDYPGFVFSGLLPWTWFSNCLGSAGYLFIHNRDLVRRPNFKPPILIAVNTLSNSIHFLIFLPILFLMLALYGRPMTLSLLFLPALFLIQGILIFGLSLITATLNVFYQDAQYVMSVAVTLLFYLTPVFYQPEAVGKKYYLLYTINPLAVLIQSYRAIFFHAMPPEWSQLFLAGFISIVLLGLGCFIYRRLSSMMFDFL